MNDRADFARRASTSQLLAICNRLSAGHDRYFGPDSLDASRLPSIEIESILVEICGSACMVDELSEKRCLIGVKLLAGHSLREGKHLPQGAIRVDTRSHNDGSIAQNPIWPSALRSMLCWFQFVRRVRKRTSTTASSINSPLRSRPRRLIVEL